MKRQRKFRLLDAQTGRWQCNACGAEFQNAKTPRGCIDQHCSNAPATVRRALARAYGTVGVLLLLLSLADSADAQTTAQSLERQAEELSARAREASATARALDRANNRPPMTEAQYLSACQAQGRSLKQCQKMFPLYIKTLERDEREDVKAVEWARQRATQQTRCIDNPVKGERVCSLTWTHEYNSTGRAFGLLAVRAEQAQQVFYFSIAAPASAAFRASATTAFWLVDGTRYQVPIIAGDVNLDERVGISGLPRYFVSNSVMIRLEGDLLKSLNGARGAVVQVGGEQFGLLPADLQGYLQSFVERAK